MPSDLYVFSRFLSEIAPNVYALYEDNRIGKLWGLDKDLSEIMSDLPYEGPRTWKRKAKKAVGYGREAVEIFGSFLAAVEGECRTLRENEMGGLANRAATFADILKGVPAVCARVDAAKTPQEAGEALIKVSSRLFDAWKAYKDLYAEVIRVNSGQASKV